ncbi:MAG: thiol-activated cytolysin family protein [Polyangia bacterium]
MATLRAKAAYYGISPALAALPNLDAFLVRLNGAAPRSASPALPQLESLTFPIGAPDVGTFIDRLFMTGIWNDTSATETVTPSGFDARGCSVKRVNARYNMSDLALFRPATAILYPGALLQGRFMNLGIGSVTPVDVPYTKRKPVSLVSSYAELGGAFQTATAADATASEVAKTIGGMLRSISTATPFNGSQQLFFESESASSVEEMARKLKVDAGLLKGKFSGVYTADASVNKSTVFVHFVQTWVAVALDRKGFRPAQFLFNNTLTVRDLENLGRLDQLGYDLANPVNNNLPTYVSSVNYGREFVFTVSSKVSSSKLEATVHAAFGSISGSLSEEQKRIINESQITVLSLGGPDELSESVIKSGAWKSYFVRSKPIPYTTLIPLSYDVFRWDGQRAAMARTTDYQTYTCPGHKVEVRVSNIYEQADIVLSNAADGTAIGITSTQSDSGWIDITSRMSGPDDEIILNDKAGQANFGAPYKRKAQLQIRIDGVEVVGPGRTVDMDGYEYCSHVHSAYPALVYKMNTSGNGVYLKYRKGC